MASLPQDGVPHGVRRVTLLVGRNGSLQLVPEAGVEAAGSLSGLGALLVATFAGGLALNALVLVALLAAGLRTRVFLAHALLIAANVLDCLLNVPAAAAVVTSWTVLVERAPPAARALCRFSAAAGQLTAVLQTLALLVLVLDRCLSLAEPRGSSSFSLGLVPQGGPLTTGKRGGGRRGRCVSAATWALLCAAGPAALCIALPVAFANVRMFPTRYACGLVREARGGADGGHGGDWLGVPVLVLGYLAPWTVLVTAVSLAARRAALQRWRRRQLELAAQQQGRVQGASGPAGGLTISLVDTPLGHLSLDEYRALTLATALAGMYLAMLVPGILSTQVLQLMALTPRTAHGPPDLWPIVTGTYETVLVWLRMQFAVVSPGVVVLLNRDVRRRVVEMMQCLYHACCCCCCVSRRANAVGQSLPQRRYGQLVAPMATPGAGAAAAPTAPSNGPGTVGKRWARLRHRNVDSTARSDGGETVVSAGTAVLFATSQGLHLRTLDPRWGVESEDADDVSTWIAGGVRGGRGGGSSGAGSGAGPSDSSFPPTHAGPWAEDSQPRYVFQFCDLAVIEDLPKYSPEASTAVAVVVPVVPGDPSSRRKVILGPEEREPSLTREELQASLAKPRSLSHSLRKNVRFASVVSEIPIAAPLPSVAEADVESGVWSDPTSSSSTTTASSTALGSLSASSGTDSPVRYARPRTRSIELALVSGELLPPPPAKAKHGGNDHRGLNHNHHDPGLGATRTLGTTAFSRTATPASASGGKH